MTGSQGPKGWLPQVAPRDWQSNALDEWRSDMRGVVRVVTGGGKTTFAHFCMRDFWRIHLDGRVLILVPTLMLLDQWYVGLREDLGIPSDRIACFSGHDKAKCLRSVNVFVINTARRLVPRLAQDSANFLVVDECHRAASPQNAKALEGKFVATLGLSATPQREFDAGFERYVVPALGPVIFDYDYVQAYRDGVITPFDLFNVQIDLLPGERRRYDALTRRTAGLLQQLRASPSDLGVKESLKQSLRARAALSAKAGMRVPVAARLVEQNRGIRTIVFHERVGSATALHHVLRKRNHSACLYHSQIAPNVRRDNLRLFRRGVFDVLVSCRALDEGIDVPEATLAIVASSTSSRRQRIQRLGRVLRPSRRKERAIVYTLYATPPEEQRLAQEARELRGLAEVRWYSSDSSARGT